MEIDVDVADAPPVVLPGRAGAARGAVAALATRLGALARQRVVQFVTLGGLLFALAPRDDDPRRVEVSPALLDAAVRRETARQGGRPLSGDEVARVRSRAIEDAVLVHEARRLGLDASDGIVRQRLVQKALFLAEDLGGAARPIEEADLRAFHGAHPELYRSTTRATFIHVFGRDADALGALGAEVRTFDGAHPDAIPPLGDPFPQRRRVAARLDELNASWGSDFTTAVAALPVGKWSAPIASRYGFHLVKVIERRDAGPAPYEEVHDRVKLDLLVARREAAVAEYVAALMNHYRVRVGGEALRDYVATARTAAHSAPSAED